MPGYLYILRSEHSGSFYIGSCLDPERRLAQHNNNAVTATRGKGPWKQDACLAFADATTARRAERLLKRLKRRDIIEKVITGNFAWPAEWVVKDRHFVEHPA